jgi:hypothetical protein
MEKYWGELTASEELHSQSLGSLMFGAKLNM